MVLSGCEEDKHSGDTGRLSLRLIASGAVTDVTTRAENEEALPEVGDFSISILQGDKVYSSWDKLSEYEDDTEFPVGSYTLKATYGNLETQGFASPYYAGQQDFSIVADGNTEVEVTCYLANVKVTTEYTEAFRSYFKDYTVKVRPEGGSEISFSKTETRAAYLKPGKFIVYADVTKQQGSSATFELATIDNAEACQHYKLKLDVDAGSAALNISFSEETEKIPVTIDVSDEALTARPPFFTPTGFVGGVAKEAVEWKALESPLSILVTARGGISKCVITTHAPSLLQQGWPGEIDLLHPEAAELALMRNMGLVIRGISENVDKMIVLDFTEVIPHIQYLAGNNESTFSLTVTDKYSRINATPFDLKIKTLSNQFDVAPPMKVAFNSRSLLLAVKLDGDISKVKFQYKAYGEWQDVTPAKMETNEDGISHQVTLDLAYPIQQNTDIRVVTASVSKVVTVETGESTFQIKSSEGDVWAKKATIHLVGDTQGTTEYLKMLRGISVQCKEGSANVWFTPTQTKVQDVIEVIGLNPNTSYTFKAVVAEGMNVKPLNEIIIKTEEELQVPNSSFEDWHITTNSEGNFPKWMDVHHYYPFSANGASYWATNNDYAQAWTVYPVQVTTCPAVIYVKDAKDGTKAAELHTSGAGGGYATTGSNLYPASYKAGRLFIGTYAWSNKTEVVSTGANFTSRPKQLTFWYKYSPYGTDTFKVEAEVRGGNGLIAKGSFTSPSTSEADSEYKQGMILFDYADSMVKANRIYINILSTTKTSFSKDDVQQSASIELTDAADKWEAHIGSRLKIDALNLVY